MVTTRIWFGQEDMIQSHVDQWKYPNGKWDEGGYQDTRNTSLQKSVARKPHWRSDQCALLKILLMIKTVVVLTWMTSDRSSFMGKIRTAMSSFLLDTSRHGRPWSFQAAHLTYCRVWRLRKSKKIPPKHKWVTCRVKILLLHQEIN